MRRRAAAILAIVLAGVAPAASAQESPGFDFVDITDFPTVRVVISPPVGTDPATVLGAHVLQDGVEQPSAVIPLTTEPVTLVLLIDISGSMQGAPLEAAKGAAVTFIDALPAGSDIAVLGFGDEVTLVAPLGVPRADVAVAIDQLEANGETALHDAMIAAIQAIRAGSHTRQFIVLLSDGGDTVSGATLFEVTRALSDLSVGFYAIELAGSELDHDALVAMAVAAGGQVIPATDASALSDAYEAIAAEVASQYAVQFQAVSGGVSLIEIVLDTTPATRFATDLALPSIQPPGPDPESSATTLTTSAMANPQATPLATTVAPPPTLFQRAWAFGLGIVLLGATLAILFGFALQPVPESGRHPLGVLRSGGQGRLRRIITRTQSRVEEAIPGDRRKGIDAALDSAGIPMRAGEYVLIVILAVLMAWAIGGVTRSLQVTVILGLLAVAVPRAVVARAAAKRRSGFADQLEGTLQLLAASLRAGYGLTQAIATAAEESASPTAEELGRVVIETRIGRDLTVALGSCAERMGNGDLAWVVDAISIQQDVGGNLAEVLDTVAGTIRDRNQIRRQVHALSAEGRLSAIILIALPFVLAAVIATLNPGYLDTLVETGTGRMLLGASAILMTIGIVWIRRIVKVIF